MADASLAVANHTIVPAVAELLSSAPLGRSVLNVRVSRGSSNGFPFDAEFDAPAGFTMLLGPSGGGKTTILNCIAGLVRADAGRIELASRVLFDSEAAINLAPGERHLGYLFQTLALFPHLTIEQNVGYGISKLPVHDRTRRITAMLDSFRIAHLLKIKPGEISGGER
jgi:molybdate transport system ATP-binding protein